MPNALERLTSLRPLFLVVDDNVDAAESLAALLESWGCQVMCAYDGPRGVELADLLRPDAVLLDLNMPGASGFETCRALRRLPWGAGTTVVAVTGSAAAQGEALADAGFDGVFVKPVDPAPLRTLLDLLRMRPQALAPDAPTTQHLPRFTPAP